MFFKLGAILLFLTVSFSAIQCDDYVSYRGYKVYEVIPNTEKDVAALGKLHELSEELDLDFWLESKLLHAPNDIMVPPAAQPAFEKYLSQTTADYSVKIGDVEASFLHGVSEKLSLPFPFSPILPRRKVIPVQGRISFNSYPRYADILSYLDEQAAKYPSQVTVKTVGTSYGNRTIKTITITNGTNSANKNTIFVDTTIHAREWIATMEGLYIIDQLLDNQTANKELLDAFNWVILPVVNPDGFEYCHTSNRLWRKTRKPVPSSCYGTDGNRNFEFHWGEVGASTNPCADTYRGEKAFSEPETIIVRNILTELKSSVKFYLTLHTYGRYLLYPWGWTSSLPPTWQDLDALVKAGASAIQSYNGARYSTGSSTNVLYAAAGGSDDWAYELGIPYSVTMEGPNNSFDPPATQINGYVQEQWVGIRAMAVWLRNKLG